MGALLASIGVPIAFMILRRLYPVPRNVEVRRSLEDLRSEYMKWELLTLLLLFTIAPIATYVWWQLFLDFAPANCFSHDAAVFSLRPPRIAWLIPAMVLGLLSAGPLIDAMLRRFLEERYPEYVAYQNLRYGFDSAAIERPFYLAFGGLAAICVFMIANWYAVFTPAEIRINPFLAVRELEFRYSDVVSIDTAPAFVAPNGKAVRRREYVLHFSDASSWSTTNEPSDASEVELRSLVKAVSERSGVPISEVPILGREEFW